MRVDDGGRRSSGVAADRARERDDPRNVRISELEERLAQLQPPNERVVRTYEQIRTDNNRVYQNTGWPTSAQFEGFVEFVFGPSDQWRVVCCDTITTSNFENENHHHRHRLSRKVINSPYPVSKRRGIIFVFIIQARSR